MGLLSWFSSASSSRRIEHPVLGEAVLVRTKRGSYWEIETEVAGKPFTVIVESPDEQAPTDGQVQFFLRYSLDPKKAFDDCSSMLIPEFEKWTGKAFPSNWEDAFTFAGMTVPAAGNETHPWDISFECPVDKAGHLFTCEFENGSLDCIRVDG